MNRGSGAIGAAAAAAVLLAAAAVLLAAAAAAAVLLAGAAVLLELGGLLSGFGATHALGWPMHWPRNC